MKTKDKKNYLKKVKNWNMVLLVLKALGLLTSIVGLRGILNPEKALYTEGVYGSSATQLYEQANSIGTKAYAVIGVIISITILIMLISAHKKLKEGVPTAKTPYYLHLFWIVTGIIYSLLFTPKIEIQGFTEFASMISIVSMGLQALVSLPAILAIIYLFKAETEA